MKLSKAITELQLHILKEIQTKGFDVALAAGKSPNTISITLTEHQAEVMHEWIKHDLEVVKFLRTLR